MRKRGVVPVKLVLLGGIVLIAAVALAYFKGPFKKSTDVDLDNAGRYKVERSDLTVTVLQSGELVAKDSNPIINETEATAKIVEIVPDGTHVKAGDLLIEMETLELEDRVLIQQTEVASADAAYQDAQEALKIKDLKYTTDLSAAELAVALAELEVKKYEEAQYPQNVRKMEFDYTIAEAELARTSTTLEAMKSLVERGFTSRWDLDKAILDAKSGNIDLKNRLEELRILKDYTHEKEFKQLSNAVVQCRADLEQLTKTHAAERNSAVVNIESKRVGLEIAKNQMKRLNLQLEKSVVYSDRDGFVFYARPESRHSTTQQIEKGMTVYPRMKIMEFPNLDDWRIKVGVPETIINRISKGLKAVVTIDALPGIILDAVVAEISEAPEQGSNFFSTRSKNYPVLLDVVSKPEVDLKPGLSVVVEIIIDKFPNVLHVPLPAVVEKDGKQYVYVVNGKKVVPREVKVGGFDERNENDIIVHDGLKEGEEVLLYAPVESDASVGLRERPTDARNGDGETQGQTPAASQEGEQGGGAGMPRTDDNPPGEATMGGGRGGAGGEQLNGGGQPGGVRPDQRRGGAARPAGASAEGGGAARGPDAGTRGGGGGGRPGGGTGADQ